MKIFKHILLGTLLTLVPFGLNGQNKKLDKAYDFFYNRQYEQSLEICDKITSKHPGYAKAYLLKSQNLYYLDRKKEALESLENYYKLTSDSSVLATLGNLSLQIKSFDTAIKYYNAALEYESDTSMIRYVKHNLKTAIFRKKAYANPVPFDAQELPAAINTGFDEYFPDITANNKLYFTRKENSENIYVSQKKDNNWTNALKLPPPVNTPKNNEGAQTVSADGKTMIFVRCIIGKGCDMYETHRTPQGWTTPVPLPHPVNSKYWDSQPCLSPDGKTLYFASNRPGGKGKSDIWMTEKINGQWTAPVSLDTNINTPGDEMSPFLHFDGQTLYFSSNGHIGMGGLDLFVSKKNNHNWTQAVNLGYPINTAGNESRLIVAPNGHTAFFSSNRDKNHNIYTFELYEKVRPEPTMYLVVRIKDSQSNKPVKAQIDIKQIKGTYAASFEDSVTIIPLDKRFEYSFFCQKQGYMFVSETIDPQNLTGHDNYYYLTIKLTPLKINQVTSLKNIFFETDSYTLLPDSYEELNNLSRFLQNNKKIKIEISGHTDNQGSYVYNMELSRKRADAVARYLINQGVSPGRITVKGYGYTKPIATNSTEEGRQLNRRVEVKITGL